MTDAFHSSPDPRELLRSQSRNELPGERGPACLDDEIIAMLADGTLDADARGRAVAHLSDCAFCRRSLASLARALDDGAVAAASRSGVASGRRLLRFGLPAAAAAVLLLAVLARDDRPDGSLPPHRAPETTTANGPVAITPLGTVLRPNLLRWRTVSGADRYRIILYDAAGRALYERELADTSSPLPDSLNLSPGEVYLWKVEARTGWNRWSSSPLFEFSVAEGQAR